MGVGGSWGPALSGPLKSIDNLKHLVARACATAAGRSPSPWNQAFPWGQANTRLGDQPVGQAQLSGDHEWGLAGQGCSAVGAVVQALEPQLESSFHGLGWALGMTSPQRCLGAALGGRGMPSAALALSWA